MNTNVEKADQPYSLLLFLVCILITGFSAEYSDASIRTNSPSQFSFTFDNDVLVPGKRDQDYTAGISVAYKQKNRFESIISLRPALDAVDGFLSVDDGTQSSYAIEAGLYGFTPEEISQTQATKNDRPFASIVYYSHAQERVNFHGRVAWQSTLTLGVLGLKIFEQLQSEVHDVTDSEEALGWHNQISDGGELTARYQLAKQVALTPEASRIEAKLTRQISLGYITEANLSLNMRVGNFNSRWWAFNPELTSYGEKSAVENRHSDNFVFFGAAIKARAYNAFLQGQFRSSKVTFNNDEIKHFLVEAWVGYTKSLFKGYQLTYMVRGHTSEVKEGGGDRDLIWGGLILNKTFY
ncbi:hypothetical protein NBRC116494_23500 [Aurantivibrio plasticivorans]